MNARLQFEAFEVAYETFDLTWRLGFALRQVTSREPLPSTSAWQMRLTALADRLKQFASRLNLSEFTEKAHATARSLLECRLAIVESFGLNESSDSGLTQLQTINELQTAMAADWGASDHLQYETFLEERVTEILQPFLAALERLRISLPFELRPFFELCRMTWTIPADLDRWGDQETADRRQRHNRLLKVIRPELQSLLQRCVSYQPGLSDVTVSYLDIVSDKLEQELHELREVVHRRLAELSEQTEHGADFFTPSGLLIPENAELANGTETETSAVDVEPLAVDLEVAAQAPSERGSQTAEDVLPPKMNHVELDSEKKVPYTEYSAGLTICGVQVEIASDHKAILRRLCDTVNKITYAQLAEELMLFRESNKKLELANMRKKMNAVRKALREAFNDKSDPIERFKDPRSRSTRYKLNRKWLSDKSKKKLEKRK